MGSLLAPVSLSVRWENSFLRSIRRKHVYNIVMHYLMLLQKRTPGRLAFNKKKYLCVSVWCMCVHSCVHFHVHSHAETSGRCRVSCIFLLLLLKQGLSLKVGLVAIKSHLVPVSALSSFSTGVCGQTCVFNQGAEDLNSGPPIGASSTPPTEQASRRK